MDKMNEDEFKAHTDALRIKCDERNNASATLEGKQCMIYFVTCF